MIVGFSLASNFHPFQLRLYIMELLNLIFEISAVFSPNCVVTRPVYLKYLHKLLFDKTNTIGIFIALNQKMHSLRHSLHP